MAKVGRFALSAAFLGLATGVPFAGTAHAQPPPPAPATVSAPPTHGNLRVRIVREAPPPRRHEVSVERPGPHHVWIKGNWRQVGQEWNWSDGRWSEPPHPHTQWVAARYEKVQGGTRYTPGHWSNERVVAD